MNKRDLIILVVITILCSLLFFGIVYSDSKIYIHLTRYFLGVSSNPPAGWLSTRPLIPLIVSPLAFFIWLPVAYGIINTLFWIGSVILMYLLTLEITRSRHIAFNASILLISNPPVLLYFCSVMLEAGSTFFALLILWLYLRSSELLNQKICYIYSLLSGIGILAKESTLPVIISILLLGIINKNLRKTLLYILLLIIPAVSWQMITTFWIGENYLTHYMSAGLEYSQERYGALFYANIIDILKAFALGHFPLSILTLILGFFNLENKKQNLTFYSLLIPALSAYFLWPFRDLRIAVVAFYATIPLAGIGLETMIKSLTTKPLLDVLSPSMWRIILYVLNFILSILYVSHSLGRFSPPWDIYLFAESSLRAGLS